MTFQKGNDYYKRVKLKTGRPEAFKSADEIKTKALKYFKESDENPLVINTPAGEVAKRKPYTIGGLCLFLGITRVTWCEYRKKSEFSYICHMIDEIIRTQKFEGASVNEFNHAIISRSIGLTEKSEVSHSGSLDSKWSVEIIEAKKDEEDK